MIRGFFDLSDGIAKGKGLDALENSKENYNQVIAYFGGRENIPSSVMKAERGRANKKIDEPNAIRGYTNTSPVLDALKNRKLSKRDHTSFKISGSGAAAGALSHFPQNIGRSVVLLYSQLGDSVVDPFAGHNSRMELCIRAGRHYEGCDLSTEFMAFNKKRASQLREEFPKRKIKLHHCDSRKMPIADEVGDFTLTSPPYYDIEYYGDEPEQLGRCDTYKDFLKGMQQVMDENYRTLKPGAFSVWFINDFRRKGKMHWYHIDIMKLGERSGFVSHDILIVDFGRTMRDCFPNQIVSSKIIPKRHEYGVVFRKPSQVKETE